MVNPHEFNARARKVSRLVDALDGQWTALGGNPIHNAAHIATTLKNWSPDEWAALARDAGLEPPRQLVRQVVIGVYARRAAARARVAA